MTRRGLFASIGITIVALPFMKFKKKPAQGTLVVKNNYERTLITRSPHTWVTLRYNSASGNWILDEHS